MKHPGIGKNKYKNVHLYMWNKNLSLAIRITENMGNQQF